MKPRVWVTLRIEQDGRFAATVHAAARYAADREAVATQDVTAALDPTAVSVLGSAALSVVPALEHKALRAAMEAVLVAERAGETLTPLPKEDA